MGILSFGASEFGHSSKSSLLILKSEIQSLKLLSITRGILNPFPEIAGRPWCTDGVDMWILGTTPRFLILSGRRGIWSILKNALGWILVELRSTLGSGRHTA